MMLTNKEAVDYIKEWLKDEYALNSKDRIVLKMAIKALSAEAVKTDCTEFIEWLIGVILDDEDWELNAVAYGEIIARKMAKLGLLEVLDGYYIRPSAKPYHVVASINVDTDEIIKRIKEEINQPKPYVQLKQSDTLIIANALQYLIEDRDRHELDRASAKKLKEQILKLGASMCADAVQGEWHEDSKGYFYCDQCHKYPKY